MLPNMMSEFSKLGATPSIGKANPWNFFPRNVASSPKLTLPRARLPLSSMPLSNSVKPILFRSMTAQS